MWLATFIAPDIQRLGDIQGQEDSYSGGAVAGEVIQ